jgi:hypothetical protein
MHVLFVEDLTYPSGHDSSWDDWFEPIASDRIEFDMFIDGSNKEIIAVINADSSNIEF